MADDRIAERQKVFKQYKEDVKQRGKPFYPYAMLHDTIMSLVVVAVIVTLAVVWKWSVPGNHASTASGWLGALYDAPANPGTFNFVPRPDWYFYFLFYLLRIFKWPSSVVLGTVGIPTVLLLLLLSMPFIDLRAERRPLRRPVALVASVLVVLSMGVLTFTGATATEALASELLGDVSGWAQKEGFSHDNPQAKAGREALRLARLHQLPHLPGCRPEQPGRTRPERRGLEEQGGRLRDRPPPVPLLHPRRKPDAVVQGAGHHEPQRARGLPRRLQGTA